MIARQPNGLLALLNEYLIKYLISFWITVSGQVAGGRLFDSELSRVTVDLPAVDDPSRRHLVIQGQVQGPATDLDRVFHDTPLAGQLPDGLLDWRLRAGQEGGHLPSPIHISQTTRPY